ncbi:substrate-binding domain-containing protein [Variovorax atrisoli]|uniref:substrate-binding domain-containing protein n=1 Tax=Variovorax atrisoli TaxID=3394203 RepID=UPI0009B7D761|nr:substrate-binding domain-containing protein [Variovorax paradoxus]
MGQPALGVKSKEGRFLRFCASCAICFVLALQACAALADTTRQGPDRGPRIGLIVSDLRNPFFMQIARSVESAIQTGPYKNARLTVVSSGFDPTRQAEQLEHMVQQRMSLVIISPIDSNLIGDRIADAQTAGIKVVAVDAAAQGADLTIMTDNNAAGRLACGRLAEVLGGRGEVAIIHGPRNTAVVDRVQGCRSALGAFPRIHLVSEALNGGASKDGGLEQMTKLLASFPRLMGIFAINDPTAIGAEVASRSAGRKMIITAVDGSPEVARRLQDGRTLISATATQSPTRIGKEALWRGMEMLHGRKPNEPVVLLQPMLLTRENAKTYSAW